MRQAQNRRQYLRVKPPPILTGSLRRHSESRITWSEWITVHARFLQGDDEVSLDKIQLQESDIRALVGTPSHHTSLTSLRPFDDVWGPVSAAMHGYLSRLYIQEAEERADRIKRGTPATAREELWSLFSRLSSQRKALMGALGSGPMNRILEHLPLVQTNIYELVASDCGEWDRSPMKCYNSFDMPNPECIHSGCFVKKHPILEHDVHLLPPGKKPLPLLLFPSSRAYRPLSCDPHFIILNPILGDRPTRVPDGFVEVLHVVADDGHLNGIRPERWQLERGTDDQYGTDHWQNHKTKCDRPPAS
ncbi:hypothetical protein DFP72DRAFT_862128 [Ephemerocybe angulata]|uniref:Uncharacterized protein n=1 Tax=Ephemerocybe angulata TaxID=980116 RepID=A0A8H6H8H3_9AGAR|nr:hypothetical protein DFP72DRAFT_862128 [Tulosesus angulatus]